ncbi:DUF724 domain-containing protein 7-like [Euphorbia lathyris]|uniref:DUF724 domain-containing protein 7-like n=1 Tax=Euphorbia lathyris TaxID=212925 RepID=UPI003313D50F
MAAINDKKMEFLTKNSMVEVRINREMFRGAWYEAKVLESKPNPKQKIWVQYQSNPPITECVHIYFIRPLPPPTAADQTYELNDIVDAFRRNGWWKGVVSKVSVTEEEEKGKSRRRYTVVFENPSEQFDYFSANLRFHFVWSDGKWVRPPNQSCNHQEAGPETRIEDSSMKIERELDAQVAAAADQEEEEEQPTYPRTRSRTKKERMPAPVIEENCANVLSRDECRVPSMSMNLAEQATESAITKCSLFDMNRDGTTKSAKKRKRGMNAQGTVQQVPAAGAAEDNVQVETVPARNTNLPLFRKSSSLWNHIDSLEVFRILPQKPHFSFLSDINDEIREGTAFGHMLTFASVVDKVTKLQINDPVTVFHSYSEALAILEAIGFDVKVVVDRVNELLILKTRREKLKNKSKRYQSSVAECDEKKAKLGQEIRAIDKMMSELEEQRALKVSQMVKEDSSREFLQLEVSSIKEVMFDVEHKFKVKSAGPWRRVKFLNDII